MFSLYSIVNVDLNVPYYIASPAKVIIDFPITKIWNKKYNCLFHIHMLKLNKDRMNAIHGLVQDSYLRFMLNMRINWFKAFMNMTPIHYRYRSLMKINTLHSYSNNS
jgi:hypothetical protein